MGAGDGAYLAEKLAFYECCEKYVTECFASGCASVVLGGTLGAHMSLIELKDVSKLYGFGDATSVALDEVSLKIEKGECVAVMGPSGSDRKSGSAGMPRPISGATKLVLYFSHLTCLDG